MATKVRLIPVLTTANGKLVKTVQFQNPRNLNSPMAAVRLFNSRNVDEMVILFIDGHIDFDLFDQIARECFMPLAVGGGITSMEDVDRLFALGADKVVIRTHTELIPAVAAKYGLQAVVYALDFRPGDRAVEPPNAGEWLVTNMNYEGMMNGYDVDSIGFVKTAQRKSGDPPPPIIANGGAGTPEDFVQAYRAGASALAASSIWFYTEYTPNMVKNYLHKHGIPVRL